MELVDLSLLPTTIDVTLHRYNYLDNKIWTQIRNQIDYIEVNTNSIIISAIQLEAILVSNYVTEIDRIKSTGSKFFHNQVNTVYFLWMLIEEMSNLQYIKLTLDFDKSYSRLLTNENNEKSIEFDFKLLSITLKLANIFDQTELEIINNVLVSLDILQPNESYTRLYAGEITTSLDQYLETVDEKIPEEIIATISDLLELFTYKIERDNPLTLLVTDY